MIKGPKKEKVYWTTKDGRILDVDEMDDDHVRNALKMVIRAINSTGIVRKSIILEDEPWLLEDEPWLWP